VYTEGELTREYEKREIRWQISRAERRKAVSLLAFRMFQFDLLALESNTFLGILEDHFQLQGDRLDQHSTDIRTCGFLTVDRHNCLRFAHKSFMEYFTALYLLGEMSNKSTSANVLNQRLLPAEILYFLGDIISSFSPGVLRILRSVANSRVSSVSDHNSLNLLNYARRPQTYLAKLDIPGLTYTKLQIGQLDISDSVINELRFTKTHIGVLNVTASSVKKISIEGSTVNAAALQSSRFESIDCIGAELRWNVTKCELKSCQLIDTVLHSSSFVDTTLVAQRAAHGSVLRDVKFFNVLFMSEDAFHVAVSKMENVVFENCIFLYVDCNASFLSKATFRRCLFIRCYLDESIDLERLYGSKGFFQTNKRRSSAKSIESPGKPFLWSTDLLDEIVREFRDLTDADEKEQRSKRLELLTRKRWEEVLAIEFRRRPTAAVGWPTLDEVIQRVEQTRSDLETLC
jgi:uncharacterized protein YjbI with pentapeptide repeats